MPIVHMIVRCNMECESFQVIQRTQQSRFMCRLCGSKQSITRVFGSGAAKDLRPICQKLNSAREVMDMADDSAAGLEHEWRDENVQETIHAPTSSDARAGPRPLSRWSRYMVNTKQVLCDDFVEDYDPQVSAKLPLPASNLDARWGGWGRIECTTVIQSLLLSMELSHCLSSDSILRCSTQRT